MPHCPPRGDKRRSRNQAVESAPAAEEASAIAQSKAQQQFRINNQIRVPQVRVIMPDGTNRGIMDIRDALELARSMHLDLIEVAPTADPPVCRILDYGRFIYEREKKERASRKSHKVIEVKGVQLRPRTTDHHLAFKIRAARRFLMAGNKVKVTMRFRGREIEHLHIARQMLDKFVQGVEDLALVESPPAMEGRAMTMVLAPTPATLAASHLKSTKEKIEAERAADKAAGYDEEAEEREALLDDEEEGEVSQEPAQPQAQSSSPEAPAPAENAAKPKTKEQIIAERKAANREKRAQKLAQEQFELP
ncbi:MAG: translation initiation factor IF-3 [Thermoflexales bacterium]|nr:translation initiation factor IF-3 [Thermoflexales bacterium]MCS7324574.1 translation initiation factor IF-3 [Thermoflexales bacterium]MCX7939911.1 translation initiation factor IF-3 [Thermoflexales bacterium]MDW8054706.1 translation initiation factor IF-3 [Anaerolineae bacterium]MDW8293360.1 translation initiation factor IF-3 [Anaerolineae bacterium]